MPTIQDAIGLIASQNLSDAVGIMHDQLGQKVLQALDTRKTELASQLFSAPSTEEK